MSKPWVPRKERKYKVSCSNCGRPAAPAGAKSALCENCVQEVLLGGKILVYVEEKTGATVIEPGYLPGQRERIVHKAPGKKGRTAERKPRPIIMRSEEETEDRVPRTPKRKPKRTPRRRSRATQKAFEERAGLIEEELRELEGED